MPTHKLSPLKVYPLLLKSSQYTLGLSRLTGDIERALAFMALRFTRSLDLRIFWDSAAPIVFVYSSYPRMNPSSTS